MIHLGTLIHGDQFNIFFPWADMDLREFIYTEWKDHRDMKKPICLLEEASNLAGAVAFLHSGIKIPGLSQVSCVHMDLKPENIVVRFDPSWPAGMWMITDFGISTIKSSSEDQITPAAASMRLSALDSVRDVEASLTRTKPKRKPGPFQAPEVQDTTARSVGRKSDIWSLGCILCLVLALGEGPGMVSRFDEERSRDKGPHLSTDYFYIEADLPTASRTGVKWELKHHVFDWLATLAEGCELQRDWVRDYVKLLKTMIVIKMDLRPDARKVHAELKTILAKAKAAEASLRLAPHLLLGQSTSPSSSIEQLQELSIQPSVSFANQEGSMSSQGNTEVPRLQRALPITGPLDSSLVRLRVPPGRTIQTAISPAGNLVAFLSEKCVFLYATKSLDNRAFRRKKPGPVAVLPASSRLEIPNGKDKQWRFVNLSGRYLLLRGRLGVALYELQPLDLRKSMEVTAHDYPNLSKLTEAKVSCLGQIVFRFTDHLKVWYPDTSGGNGRVYPLTITGRLEAASFSNSGNFLYAWACGSGPKRWYIWHVHNEAPPLLVCSDSYDADRHGSPIEALIPMDNKAAFITREDQGKLSIKQKFSTTSRTARFPKQLSGIIVCTYAPVHDALIVIRHSRIGKPRVEMLRLLSNSDGSITFATGSGLRELGRTTCDVRDGELCGVAVTETDAAESLSLLITHPDGVLERLTS